MGFEGLAEIMMGIIACIAVVAVIFFIGGGFVLHRFVKKWAIVLPAIYWLLTLLGFIVFFGVDLGGGAFGVVVPIATGLPFTFLALPFAPESGIGSFLGTIFVVVAGTLQYFLLGLMLDAIRKKYKKTKPSGVQSKSLRRLWAGTSFFWIGFVGLGIGFILYAICAELLCVPMSSGVESIVPVFMLGFIIWGNILGCILLHHCWALIQDGEARTSPGKAVGFCFIPVFNIYWPYVAYVGLSKELNAYCENKQIDGRVSERLARSWFILFACGIGLLIGICIFDWIMSFLSYRIDAKTIRDALDMVTELFYSFFIVIPLVGTACIVVFVIMMKQFTNVGRKIIEAKATLQE